MSPEFESIYQRHALTSYEKQLRLADVIGMRSWRFSMEDGCLTFEEEGEAPHASAPIVFAAQLLGTIAYNDSTWLWSWANEASQIPSALTRDAQRLRAADPATEWTTSQFALNLDNADEHRLAMASSGLLAPDLILAVQRSSCCATSDCACSNRTGRELSARSPRRSPAAPLRTIAPR